MKTENFDIHFPDGGYDFALRTAGYLEEAHRKLVPLLGHRTRLRTQVVLTDDVDFANGSARVVPYPLIRGYMAPPVSDSFLSHYDDFLRLLMIHEYAHVLHLDNAQGVYEIGNRIFGRQLTPNHLAPKWLIEGFAVWFESNLSAGGRNNYSMVDMVLRTMILENGKIMSLEELGGPIASWPEGRAWYFLGGRFFDYIIETRGEAAFSLFAKDYGSRIIPYSWNHSARRTIGQSYLKAWKEWTETEIENHESVIAGIIKEGPIEGTRISDNGRTLSNPRWSGDGKSIYSLVYPGDARPSIRIFDSDFKPEEDSDLPNGIFFKRANGVLTFDVSSDGNIMILSVSDSYRLNYRFNDLWILDTRNPSSLKRLTSGMRLRSPALSPDSKRIAFVSLRRGETALYLASLDFNPDRDFHNSGSATARIGRPVRIYHKPGREIDRPVFSPCGTKIVFSSTRKGTGRDLLMIDISDADLPSPIRDDQASAENVFPLISPDHYDPGKNLNISEPVYLVRDGAENIQPSFDPTGKKLFYSSDRSGIFDIYSISMDSEERCPGDSGNDPGTNFSEEHCIRRITRTLTGAFEPLMSRDGKNIYYVKYHAEGFDLASIPYDPDNIDDIPDAPEDSYEPFPVSGQIYPVSSYKANLRPFRWIPYSGNDRGGTTLGISTDGSDPVGLFSWRLSLWGGIQSRRPGYSAFLSWTRLSPTPSLSSSYSEIRTSAFHIREGRFRTYEESSWRLSPGLSLSMPSNTRSRFLSLSLTADQRRIIGGIPRTDPGEPAPLIPEDGLYTRARVYWASSSISRQAENYVPFEGNSIRLSAEYAFRGLDYSFALTTGGATGHTKIPFTQNNVISGNIDYGIGTGGFGGRNLFSLGGLPVDGIMNMVMNPGGRSSSPVIRGFPPASLQGNAFLSTNLEYRFRIVAPERGIWVWPVFIRRFHAAAFIDSSIITPRLNDFNYLSPHTGIGIEGRSEFVAAYYMTIHLRLGIARGFGPGGGTLPYIGLGSPF